MTNENQKTLREYLKEVSGGLSNSIDFNYHDSFSIYTDKNYSHGLTFVSNLSLAKTINEDYTDETFDIFVYGKTFKHGYDYMPLCITVSSVEEVDFLIKKLQTYIK